MYFSIYDPYDEKYDIFLRDIIKHEDILFKKHNENDIKECIICWEESTNLNEVTHLQLTNIIDIKCQCNVHIHEKCLRLWVKNYHSCPICRTHANLLDISFSDTSENIISIWYIFLQEYKNIFYIIFTYLVFLQISIFYFLIMQESKYHEISDVI